MRNIKNVKGRYWVGAFLYLFFLGSCGKGDNKNSSVSESSISSIQKKVSFNSDKVQYIGRVGIKSDAAYLYWPGTQVKVRFEGKGLSAILQDDKINRKKHHNYFYVIVDSLLLPHKIELNGEKKSYTLVDNLSKGKHTVTLFKLNAMHPGYPIGYAKFFGFEVKDEGEILNPPPLRKRKMEFYGNSITTGWSNQAPNVNKDLSGSEFENNYWSYAAITARYFNTQYVCIAKAGIGLIKGTTKPNMAKMHNLINPFDASSHWNFSKYIPDIVVINLLQNDASKSHGVPNRSMGFLISKYKGFIYKIRDKYPQSYIICALGSMSAVTKAKWRQTIMDAVQQMHDERIYTFFFNYLGRGGHPRIADDKNMANQLISFIKNNVPVNW